MCKQIDTSFTLLVFQITTTLTLSLDALRLLFLAAVLACSLPAYGLFNYLCPIFIALLAYVVPLPAVLGLALAAGHSIAAAKKSINSKGECPLFAVTDFTLGPVGMELLRVLLLQIRSAYFALFLTSIIFATTGFVRPYH